LRVLIVKLGAMGDVIMSLSMISALRSLDPRAHVTWMVGKGSRALLELVDCVDRLVVLDETRLLRGALPGRIREVATAWRSVCGESFDLVVTAHRDRRYRILAAPVRARERRSFSHSGRSGPIPGRYHGNEYARLILGQDGPGNRQYALPEIARVLPPVPFERSGKDSIVVLAPGGARNVLRDDPLRRWPVEFYAEVARRELARSRQVVLVGGEGDVQLRPCFAGLPLVDLIGRTSVPELVATVRAANVVVTHDSLVLHLAQLARAPIVALFGPTSPSERMCAPPMQHAGGRRESSILWGGAHLPCRPCYDGLNYARCPVNKCMHDLSPEMVTEAIEQVIRPGER
jgi:heptosyltransferase-2